MHEICTYNPRSYRVRSTEELCFLWFIYSSYIPRRNRSFLMKCSVSHAALKEIFSFLYCKMTCLCLCSLCWTACLRQRTIIRFLSDSVMLPGILRTIFIKHLFIYLFTSMTLSLIRSQLRRQRKKYLFHDRLQFGNNWPFKKK